MSDPLKFLLATIVVFAVLGAESVAQDSTAENSSAEQRRQRAHQFHLRAQQRTGVLVPMYVYPANIEDNRAFNGLIDLKRQYETVPMWVIVNPASGPGERIDPNYTTAIARLRGAGCVVLGYVSTRYGKRTQAEAQQDIERWLEMYPGTQGIFFDEMLYEDTDAGAEHQAALNRYAHGLGYWPTVANPGADTPERYFAADAADVILVHEGDYWPTEERLKGDTAGGYADYPPFSRGILLHSQPKLDKDQLQMARKYVRWIYVTDDLYRSGDPKAANPWDSISKHLNAICEQLSQN